MLKCAVLSNDYLEQGDAKQPLNSCEPCTDELLYLILNREIQYAKVIYTGYSQWGHIHRVFSMDFYGYDLCISFVVDCLTVYYC